MTTRYYTVQTPQFMLAFGDEPRALAMKEGGGLFWSEPQVAYTFLTAEAAIKACLDRGMGVGWEAWVHAH